MKQCPQCKTTYTDATLSYCLSDGATLNELDEQATVVRPAAGGQMRVEIPQETQAANIAATAFTPAGSGQGGQSGGGMKIILGVLAAILLIGAIVVIAGLAFYFSSKRTEVASVSNNSNNANRTATPGSLSTPSPASNANDELRDQIASLEKRLNEQKNANKQSANLPPAPPNQPTTGTVARVNSPGDGFLALRTLPNSELGDRILKIPHGATVSIGACGPVVRPVNRAGRWCQASYNGRSGWVFDAYLIY